MRIQMVNKNVYATFCSRKSKCISFLVPCRTMCEMFDLGLKIFLHQKEELSFDIFKESNIPYMYKKSQCQ